MCLFDFAPLKSLHFSNRRGYSARVLNLRAISIRNELKVHGLNSKISFLERKVDRSVELFVFY